MSLWWLDKWNICNQLIVENLRSSKALWMSIWQVIVKCKMYLVEKYWNEFLFYLLIYLMLFWKKRVGKGSLVAIGNWERMKWRGKYVGVDVAGGWWRMTDGQWLCHFPPYSKSRALCNLSRWSKLTVLVQKSASPWYFWPFPL